MIGPINTKDATSVYELLQSRGIRVKKVKYLPYPNAKSVRGTVPAVPA